MASPFVWKVYNSDGELIATTRYPEDAAAVIAFRYEGTIKVDGRVVWREEREVFSALDSRYHAVDVMLERREEHANERSRKDR